MANLTRSAKSASKWTLNDLDSYNITLKELDPCSFFGLQGLPQPSVDHELLENVDAGAMQQVDHAQLINYLDYAMTPEGGKSAVIDFVFRLFRPLGYVHLGQYAHKRVDLPLSICGENRHAETSVCIINHSQESNHIVLLVQAVKRSKHEPVNTPAQLVAEAVAAFNKNNAKREAIGHPPLAEQVIPAIIMVGTSPVFYKIPVTRTLSTHIRHGTYPPEETRVTYCYPIVPRPSSWHEILKCYEAFKTIVGI
ncbi:hypothetical protein BGY98DRAFT_995401 [Russula aff. rugulosa BPL654]|nr:hypothetical protein BGY98DRAFT_995401 [Russula aff. rugulosa BPL654]